MKRKRMRYLWWTLAVLFLCAAVVAALFYTGVLKFNNPSRNTYPVRGVDVSSYQGTIDWEVLSSQNIQFAFIKATEGSGFVDPCFVDNLAGASETSLYIGAYHFFSFESSGKTRRKISSPPSPGNRECCRLWSMWSCTGIFRSSRRTRKLYGRSWKSC